MHAVEQPVDELVRVVMLVIVEQGVRLLQCLYELPMVEGSLLFLVLLQGLEEIVELEEHVVLGGLFGLGWLRCLLLILRTSLIFLVLVLVRSTATPSAIFRGGARRR